MFIGSITAIVTPFNKYNQVDETRLRELVDFQILNGTTGIVPVGTTGESPTLTHQEHERVIEIVVNAVGGRVPVIAGTGSNSTSEAITFTRHAEREGADAALVVTPYYNKPTQQGLYLHFKAVAESVNIPIILYNIEGRCARNIETETVARLARDCKNIIGVKEASGNLSQVKDVIAATPKDFIVLSGDDALTVPIIELGGKGTISVLANIAPKATSDVINKALAGDIEGAKEDQEHLLPLIKALFIESNPAPVKVALELLGKCSGDVRLPLCRMESENLEILIKELKNSGLFTEQLQSIA